jgi:hypothetical protein
MKDTGCRGGDVQVMSAWHRRTRAYSGTPVCIHTLKDVGTLFTIWAN